MLVKFPVVEFKVVMFPVIAFVVVALEVEALLVAKLEVLPQRVAMVARVEFKVLINAVRNPKVSPEIFVTVVDARVDDPVAKIFPNVPVPETVVEPAERPPVTVAFPAVIFPETIDVVAKVFDA